MVHEDAPHHASGHREEMRAVLPLDVFGVDQPQIRLVDERRRLKAVPGTLSCHAASRDLVELPVDERNQSVEGGLVALPPFQKQPGDLRGVVRNAAILSPFAWFTVSRPRSRFTGRRCATRPYRGFDLGIPLAGESAESRKRRILRDRGRRSDDLRTNRVGVGNGRDYQRPVVHHHAPDVAGKPRERLTAAGCPRAR